MLRHTDRLRVLLLVTAVAVSLPAFAASQAVPPAASRDSRIRTAERALTLGPFSVMQKSRMPPSGDKHDFLSQAPYWWPDPTKADGMPYVRRDGEVNPESRSGTDDGPFGQMQSAVYDLAVAYRETADERYGSRAALLLRTWFLDPATRMNPHLNFGQAVPGHTSGRAAGIIATRRLVRVVDAARMLASSPSLSGADRAGLEGWCRAYAMWLRTSAIGRDEASARNNHGTWYDAQLVALLLYTGQHAEAQAVLASSTRKRLAAQIEPDGPSRKNWRVHVPGATAS